MITIIVDNRNEYESVMEYAKRYVCTNMPFVECGKYKPGTCKKCFKENHIKVGINVISLVDREHPDYL